MVCPQEPGQLKQLSCADSHSCAAETKAKYVKNPKNVGLKTHTWAAGKDMGEIREEVLGTVIFTAIPRINTLCSHLPPAPSQTHTLVWGEQNGEDCPRAPAARRDA